MKEAQQRRWAKIRGESEPTAPVIRDAAKPKRKMSAAGRKAISEATKKRWAAFHAAKKAAVKKPQKRAAKAPGAAATATA
jgi:hypothetical protein